MGILAQRWQGKGQR